MKGCCNFMSLRLRMDDTNPDNTSPLTKQIINGIQSYDEAATSSTAEIHRAFPMPPTSLRDGSNYETWSKILPAISSTLEPPSSLATRAILPHITQAVSGYSPPGSHDQFSQDQSVSTTANILPSFFSTLFHISNGSLCLI